MNGKRESQETFRTLQLMNELEQDENISQRELASRLGIAVGLVNSYLKNLAAKGWVRIKNYPRNRYAYLLTPKGLSEKSRLAYQHISYFNNLYTVMRQDYHALFCLLKSQGHKGVVFCGVDEVAEIAYFSLRDTGLELVAVLDDINDPMDFLGQPVSRVKEFGVAKQPVVLTSFKRRFELRTILQAQGVDESLIFSPNEEE